MLTLSIVAATRVLEVYTWATYNSLGPRQVYRPRRKEPSNDESEWSFNMDNYFRGSEEETEKKLESQFKEEEAEGRMEPFWKGGEKVVPRWSVEDRCIRDTG